MAEFVQTMKDLKRMCDKYFDGENWVCNKTCPMYGFEVCSKPTAKFPVPLDIGQDLAHKIDCAITTWAKDNPEPVYPTWEEWLEKQGVLDYRVDYNPLTKRVDRFLNSKAKKPIPADTAQKLGIEPKEE